MPIRRSSMPRALLIALVALACAGQLGTVASEPAPSHPYRDVLPDRRGEIIARTSEDISQYAIEAEIDAATGAILGEQTIIFTNATLEALDDVFFRLFPNADYYGEGDLTVWDVTVDGQEVAIPVQDGDPTVLRVPLTEALTAGEEVEITMAFETAVPADTEGSYGILNRDSVSGTWVLADWYPILAGYEPETGWRLDPPTSFGDPTFGDAALYDVTLDAPPEWEMVSSGSAVSRDDDELHHWIAGPAREFSLVANAGELVAQGDITGTELNVYAGAEMELAAEIVYETAAAALIVYGDLLGAYPYRELDVVATPLAGAAGVSWAGIIFLDLAEFDLSRSGGPDALAFTVAHEVGHQWWGGIVGVNSNDHTFMTEGITNASTIIFLEERAGEEAAAAALQTQIAGPYLDLLDRSGDQVVDVPIAEGQHGRGAIWYGKAALGFIAIRQEIGDEAFLAALESYARTFAQRIAEPSDLLAAFEHASGEDLDALWHFWFEAAETTPADVEAVVEAAEAARLLDGRGGMGDEGVPAFLDADSAVSAGDMIDNPPETLLGTGVMHGLAGDW
ncbi:MAG TPA: M1 family aminopeptidase [Thermomicrobiales bacterium]|nr:M1 family aminopeptidase [Thermomicrobiales bacterium]